MRALGSEWGGQLKQRIETWKGCGEERQKSSWLMEQSPFLNQHTLPPQLCPSPDWAAYCKHPSQEKRARIFKPVLPFTKQNNWRL